MKVLLIAPTYKYKSQQTDLLSFSDFPSGIAYIAGALKEGGHEVVGLNPNNHLNYDKPYFMLANLLSKAITEHQPDLIGTGGLCIDYPFLKDATELIRKFAPKTPIVLGGGIVNNDREFIFNHLKPEFGIIGEGEDTVVKLANTLKSGENDFASIDNLSFWGQDHEPIHTKVNHNYRPIDERPYPDYDVFGCGEMIEKYSQATRVLYRSTRLYPKLYSVLTARHCPFSCTFCVHRSGVAYRARSIPKVMEEIRVAYEKYHFNILLILDELFTANKQRMNDFSSGVLEGREKYGWDFDWTFQTHASAALDEDSLRLAKKAGLYYFSYGIESGSQTVLDSMNKRVKVAQIEEGIKMAEKVGVGFGGNLIFGDIAETESTLKESLDFYGRHGTLHCIFLTLLMPYPGNKLFDTCIERGAIKDKAEYYAHIDEGIFNLTQMPNNVWLNWVNFLTTLERTWLCVKVTEAISAVKEENKDGLAIWRNGDYYIVDAKCPYCHEDIRYRELFTRGTLQYPIFLGTNCIKCGSRIRIDVLSVMKKLQREETKHETD